MIAGPSSSRRKARTRSTERVISVFGRSSTGKPARYIFEPARDSPSGSLTTSTPSGLSRRPKSSAGLNASPSAAPALGLLRRKMTSKSTSRAVFARRVGRGQRLRVRRRRRAGAPTSGRTTSATMSGPLALRERVDRRERDVVPAPVGRERQVQRRVRRRCVRGLLTTKQMRIWTYLDAYLDRVWKYNSPTSVIRGCL